MNKIYENKWFCLNVEFILENTKIFVLPPIIWLPTVESVIFHFLDYIFAFATNSEIMWIFGNSSICIYCNEEKYFGLQIVS